MATVTTPALPRSWPDAPGHPVELRAEGAYSRHLVAFLAILVLGALAVAPILAIVALVRVHRLERARAEGAELASRVRRLEQRLSNLERGPGSADAGPAVAAAPPAPVPRPAQAPHEAAAPPPPARRRAPAVDLETMIGGRWLLRVGIVALLLAVAFFLKYAFDNQWIGPAGRVALGLVAGVALVVYSQWLLGRGFVYFSEGIAAAGAGVLYLSLYEAWTFDLIPQAAAFAGMVLVTAAFAAIAVGRDSQRIALLALAGGMMTPGVLSTGVDRHVVLFTYLAVLDGGLLILARARAWRWLEPFALAATVFYFAAWYSGFYGPEKLGRTLAFSSLFFAEFAAIAVLHAWRARQLFPEQSAVVLANAAWFMSALHVMLYREHRWGLTAAVLGLAAAHLVALLALPRPSAGPSSGVRLLYGGLALMFVTVAIPVRLEGEWITIAWSAEGALLVWNGFRSDNRWLRWTGHVLFVLVVVRLLPLDVGAPQAIFNARFGAFASAIAAFAAAALMAQGHRERLPADERRVFAALAVGVNVLAVWALSLEVWDYCGRVRFGIDHELAQQMGLSLVWIGYATVLIVTGVRRASAALRWQGLALLGLAIFKVFVFDLSFLERIYRILSFFVLGVVLLVVSFLYQRKLFGGREAGGS